MEKESIRAIFNGNEEEIYQACAKFFYRHPECLTTLERQRLYDVARKKWTDKIMKELPQISLDEAKSIVKMRCLMSSKIRPGEIDAYRELVLAFAESMKQE